MIAAAARPLLSLRSPGGSLGRLTILIFHRVLSGPDPLFPGEIDTARFARICLWLRQSMHVLPLDEAVTRLRQCTLPPRAAAITFDDGYADNHALALPILQRHGLSATFFIATGFLDGGRMWNDTVIESLRRCEPTELDLDGLPGGDLGRFRLTSIEERRRAVHDLLPRIKHLPAGVRERAVAELAHRAAASLPDDLMLTASQVVELHRAGMGIGAHTQSHPILAGLGDQAVRDEMRNSRDLLQDLLDAPVTLFAYPNGKPGRDYGPRAVAIAAEQGFTAAVSTAPGVAHAGSDLMQLPRFTPWRTSALSFAGQLLRNLGQTASAVA
jgi:peptidoglycan/xylan/chitin deacetylase (PgdA/CDA1 family)